MDIEAPDTGSNMPRKGNRRVALYLGLLMVAGALSATLPLRDMALTTIDFLNTFRTFAEDRCQVLLPFVPTMVCQVGVSTYLAPWLYVLLFLVILAESKVPAEGRSKLFSSGLRHDFTMWFGINGVGKAVGGLLALMFVGWIYETYLTSWTLEFPQRWSKTTRFVVGLIASDFMHWFTHFVRHKVPLFWQFHAVHHSQREMNIFTDYRVHFMEYLIARPMHLIPLLMLGLPVDESILAVILLRCYTLLYHGNIRSDFGVLKYLLVTPQSHRVHHSALAEHRDKNFGVILSVWDRMLGTHCSDRGAYPPTGIADPAFPMEPGDTAVGSLSAFVKQTLYPFKSIVRAWLPGNAR